MKQKLLAAALALAMLFALLPAAAWAEEGQPTGQTPAAFRAQNAGAARGGAVNELESALYI